MKIEAKYGKDLFNKLTTKTGRSLFQTEFLYELVDEDFDKLLKLEENLKNYFIFWVPADQEGIDYVLSQLPQKKYFNLDDIRTLVF